MRLKISSATNKQAKIRGERLPNLCGGSVELSVIVTSERSGDPQALQASSAATPCQDRDFVHAQLPINTSRASLSDSYFRYFARMVSAYCTKHHLRGARGTPAARRPF
jgi:hypothetical protein